MSKALWCRLACLVWIVTLAGCGGVSSGNGSLSAAEKVAAAKAALMIGYASGDSASSVTKNLTLSNVGIDGTTITWTSNNPAVVTNAGVVTQPMTQHANATLTATVSLETASDTKTFPIKVKAQMTEAEAVVAAKAALAVGYASGDSASSVTQNLTLPATGIDTSTITWVSSAPAVVSNGEL